MSHYDSNADEIDLESAILELSETYRSLLDTQTQTKFMINKNGSVNKLSEIWWKSFSTVLPSIWNIYEAEKVNIDTLYTEIGKSWVGLRMKSHSKQNQHLVEIAAENVGVKVISISVQIPNTGKHLGIENWSVPDSSVLNDYEEGLDYIIKFTKGNIKILFTKPGVSLDNLKEQPQPLLFITELYDIDTDELIDTNTNIILKTYTNPLDTDAYREAVIKSEDDVRSYISGIDRGKSESDLNTSTYIRFLDDTGILTDPGVKINGKTVVLFPSSNKNQPQDIESSLDLLETISIEEFIKMTIAATDAFGFGNFSSFTSVDYNVIDYNDVEDYIVRATDPKFLKDLEEKVETRVAAVLRTLFSFVGSINMTIKSESVLAKLWESIGIQGSLAESYAKVYTAYTLNGDDGLTEYPDDYAAIIQNLVDNGIVDETAQDAALEEQLVEMKQNMALLLEQLINIKFCSAFTLAANTVEEKQMAIDICEDWGVTDELKESFEKGDNDAIFNELVGKGDKTGDDVEPTVQIGEGQSFVEPPPLPPTPLKSGAVDGVPSEITNKFNIPDYKKEQVYNDENGRNGKIEIKYKYTADGGDNRHNIYAIFHLENQSSDAPLLQENY